MVYEKERERQRERKRDVCVQRPFLDSISKKFKPNIVVVVVAIACWQSFSSLLSFFRTCMNWITSLFIHSAHTHTNTFLPFSRKSIVQNATCSLTNRLECWRKIQRHLSVSWIFKRKWKKITTTRKKNTENMQEHIHQI